MNCTLLILVVSIFSFTLNLIFFFRKHIKTKETKIFSYLLIVNFIGLIVELVCAYIGYNYETNNLFAHIFTKIYLIYLMTYLFIMTLYVYLIAYSKKEDYYKKLRFISYIIYILFSIIVVFLPIKTDAGFATGFAVSFVYIVVVVVLLVSILAPHC